MRQLIQSMLPVIVANGTDVIMRFCDQFFLSRVTGNGEELLAAALNGGALTQLFYVTFIMFLNCTNSLVSQSSGANNIQLSIKIVYQGFYLSLLFAACLLFIYPLFPSIYRFFAQDEKMVDLSMQYATPLLLLAIFPLLRTTLSAFFIASNRSYLAMRANLLALICNIPLNYLLIFGAGGIPALGLKGAALATMFANVISVLLLFKEFWSSKVHKKYNSRHFYSYDGQLIKKFFRYGGPSGIEGFVNMSNLNVFILSVSAYGPVVATAMTITFSWDLLVFIPLTGINQATTALVGFDIGAGNIAEAQRKTLPILLLCLCYVFPFALIFTLFPQLLFLPFTYKMHGGEEVLSLARIFMRLAAFYLFFDAVSQVLLGFLKAAGDTLVPMLGNASLHLLMGLSVFYGVKYWQLAPQYCWGIFSLMLMFIAIFLFFRYRSGQWKNIRLLS